jgi:hypothetical protein
MIHRSNTHLLLPLLAMGLTLALASSALAQTSGSIQVSFGTTPHWTTVQHTNVKVIREQDRPNYDVFHYGNEYYVYRDNRWYQSRHSNGSYTYVDERYVPRQLSQVPSNHWRNYPTDWVKKNQDPHYSQHGNKHDSNGHDQNGQGNQQSKEHGH